MIKKIMLNRKITKSLKYREIISNNDLLEQPNCIGIIINFNDLNPSESIESIIQKLNQDNFKVRVISYMPNTKNIPNEFILKGYHYFNSSDFNIYGEIVSKKIDEFISHQYDKLYVISSTRNDYIDLLVAKAKARVRMGLHIEKRKDVYELGIELEKYSTDLLISQLNTYSKIIS